MKEQVVYSNINLAGHRKSACCPSCWFSWRYESLLRFGIGGRRFFPRVAAIMISKWFCQIAYKSALLNVMENMMTRMIKMARILFKFIM